MQGRQQTQRFPIDSCMLNSNIKITSGNALEFPLVALSFGVGLYHVYNYIPNLYSFFLSKAKSRLYISHR